MATLSFLIVDDHPLFLEALQAALQACYADARIEVAETIASARARLAHDSFDLILVDLKLPDASGLDGLRDVRMNSRGKPVAVVSALGGADIVSQVKDGGASGFINKSQKRTEILAQVARLLQGERVFPAFTDADPRSIQDGLIDRLRQLTPQQLKVLQRVCEAKLNKQIAFELGVTETTVKAHITLIFKKLGVHSRTQAVLQLQRLKNELEDSEFAILLQAAA
jgi:DNA-binding NarL/FixJ family response regulator